MSESSSPARGTVLVTGGSGFIAGHCVLALVDAGYSVRTTVRSLSREAEVRETLAAAGLRDQSRLSFVAADLMDDAGWGAAMEGVDGVLHVASPVMPGHVKDEDEVIRPAKEGTVRVLRAAHEAGVRRVVLTSAFHAVAWGHPHDEHVFTEEDWTVLHGPGVDAYGRAKTLAEQAAWEYVRGEGSSLELVTMLPTAVMGPVMGGKVTGSNNVIRMLLSGSVPMTPRIFLPVVDVHDVAAAHVLALESPEAAGERFILSDGPALEMAELARLLRVTLGPAARRVPRRRMPDVVMRATGLVSKEMRANTEDLGYAPGLAREGDAGARLGAAPGP